MRVPITSIRENPSNPRKLDRAKFEKLVQSIRDFPEMLDKRPIIVADGIILGGNMRHKAAIQAGMNEIPIIDASDWTEEQRQQFIIKDNVSFGEWDWDLLANEWDASELEEWGLDVWIAPEEPMAEDLIGEEKDNPPTLKITFASPEQLQKAEIEIQEFLDRECPGAYFSISVGAA
jgi:hypothetical protein